MTALRSFKLTLAYDGAAYAGWQRQPDVATIQEVVETAIEGVTGERVRIAGSGRTDAGVHALGQVASCDLATRLPPETLLRAISAHLPEDVALLEIVEATPGFHALRDCVRKRYRYLLDDGRPADLFRRRYAWHIKQRLDVDAMARAAAGLVGEHDFRSFETTGSPRESTIRRVYDVSVARRPPPEERFIEVEVEANGFLYNMVRAIVGTLVQVGRGKRGDSWPAEALAARDRSAAGPTAPAHGLYLLRVQYDDAGGE